MLAHVAVPDGPVLESDLRIAEPAVPARGSAVLVHPHPAFGGHRDVWLLPLLAARLAAAGWTTLRIDTRGVRRSTGTSGDGAAEGADVAAAAAHVRSVASGADRCAVIGWSFGALAALHAPALDPAITDWVGIAAPTRPVPDVALAPLPPLPAVRRAAVVGELDPWFGPATLGVLALDAVRVLPGADHFFFDRDDDVADAVLELLR